MAKFSTQKAIEKYFDIWSKLLEQNLETVTKAATIAVGPIQLINVETLTPIEKRILMLLLPIDVEDEDITKEELEKAANTLLAGFLADPINLQHIIDSYPIRSYAISTNKHLPSKVKDFLLTIAEELGESPSEDTLDKMLKVVASVRDIIISAAKNLDKIKQFLQEYKSANAQTRKNLVDSYASDLLIPKYILKSSTGRKALERLIKVLEYIPQQLDPYQPLAVFTGLSEDEIKKAAEENTEIEVSGEDVPLIQLINAMLNNDLEQMDNVINDTINTLLSNNPTIADDE